MTFLSRGRTVATVQMGAPPASDMGNSAQTTFPQGLSLSLPGIKTAIQGQVSLSVLGGLIVGSVLFYLWTRDAQGS